MSPSSSRGRSYSFIGRWRISTTWPVKVLAAPAPDLRRWYASAYRALHTKYMPTRTLRYSCQSRHVLGEQGQSCPKCGEQRYRSVRLPLRSLIERALHDDTRKVWQNLKRLSVCRIEGAVPRPLEQHDAPPRFPRGNRLQTVVRGKENLVRVLGAERQCDILVRGGIDLAPARRIEKPLQVRSQVADRRVPEQVALRLARSRRVNVCLDTLSVPLDDPARDVLEQGHLDAPVGKPCRPDIALDRLERGALPVGVHILFAHLHTRRHHILLRADALKRRPASRLVGPRPDQGNVPLHGRPTAPQVLAQACARVWEHLLMHERYGRHGSLYVQDDKLVLFGGRWHPVARRLCPLALAAARPIRIGPVHQRMPRRGRQTAVDPHAPHLDCRLEQILVRLKLRLGLDPGVAPHVDTVPLHQHRVALRVLCHRLAQAIRQLALPRRVLYDWNPEGVVKAVTGDALDHLDVCDLELVLKHQRRQHCIHRMPMQHRPRVAQLVGRHEQRRALGQLGRLVRGRPGDWRLLHGAVRGQHKHVARLHPLLLHA
mmetsp:Transcript_9/g.20  ORF Transcript_9/g.20 Transcript_9/m.20 type:complete len:543 (-) Transcript_9:134-1762(-)